MKNNNTEIKYTKKINYENESLTIIKECCDNLIKNNFYSNSKTENLSLLEKSLLSYSILKLLSWNKNEFDMNILTNLDTMCSYINSQIPTSEESESFFFQYIHCINFVTGKINNQNQIPLTLETIEDEVIIELNKNIITQITINKDIPIYQIPSILLTKIKEIFEKEKILSKK